LQSGIRSFIAVEVPEEAVAKLEPVMADLAKLGSDLRIVHMGNLHFTLKFLGNISQDMVLPIKSCMDSVRDMLGFDLSLRGMGAFPNPRRARVVWVGASSKEDQMVGLARTLDEKLSQLGFARERSHVPHLTVARSRSRRSGQALVQFIENMRDLEVHTMRVDKIILKKSVLTPKGPIYSDLLAVGAGGE
jgi:2'-5' RNA ligase